MLVLTRRKDEAIYIDGDNIKITIVELKNGTVKIGVEAPKNISVHREEVYKAIKNEKRVSIDGR